MSEPNPCVRCGSTERSKDGRCSACARKKALEYRNRDPEAARVKERAWRSIHKNRLNEKRAELKKNNPEYYRELNRKTKYNLAPGEFAAKLFSQGNCCAICKTTDPGGRGTFHVDHDHTCCDGIRSCGKCVRGILCNQCNLMVGHSGDRASVLLSAVNYLRTWKNG